MSELNDNLSEILRQKTEYIVPQNIKKDVTVFGVTGTLVEGTDTSDANAVASDIAKNKTAYVNGNKITGRVAVTEADEAWRSPITSTIYNDIEDNILDHMYQHGNNNTTSKIILSDKTTVIESSSLPSETIGKNIYISYFQYSNRYYYMLAYTNNMDYKFAHSSTGQALYLLNSDKNFQSFNYYTFSSATKLDFNSINWGSVNTATYINWRMIGCYYSTYPIYLYRNKTDCYLWYNGQGHYRYLQQGKNYGGLQLLRPNAFVYTPINTDNIIQMENITPEKIKKNESILGVVGTLEGENILKVDR